MAALSGSLLHAVLLAGMIVVVAFKPERVASWASFRIAVVCFALALALPAIVGLLPVEPGRVDTWSIRFVAALSGILTALSVYALLAACGGRASRTG